LDKYRGIGSVAAFTSFRAMSQRDNASLLIEGIRVRYALASG
jgi:hypothetical protein